MSEPGLGGFLRRLEAAGELARVGVEVDAVLEAPAIAIRALREGRPAPLFERVRGSRFPLAMNILATERRIELALGRHPAAIGEDLLRLLEDLSHPSPRHLLRNLPALRRVACARARRVRRPRCQEVVESAPRLGALPVTKSWPKDGGRTITLGLVLTRDPETDRPNLGIYRVQVFDDATAGMHWQIGKGGGFHYAKAERAGRGLDATVAVGADPSLILAAAAPLPEGLDELAFAGYLRGRATPIARARSVDADVLAGAEFSIEGHVPRGERRPEGPFGDHFGHYSPQAPFPVLRVRALTRRRRPAFPATVVGPPPMEDRAIGDAVQQLVGPLARVIHPEVRDLWAYYEAGFHNLVVVAVEERYRKEAAKTALSLLGEGQLSLAKVAVAVSGGVDPRDPRAVLREIRGHFSPEHDLYILPRMPLDTLDFTSGRMEIGAKLLVDATRDPAGPPPPDPPRDPDAAGMKRREPAILGVRVLEGALLAVRVRGAGRPIVERLVADPGLSGWRFIAAVSEDIDLADRERLIWGIFTRFDAERDLVPAGREWSGAAPVWHGPIGIDATWKEGYPEPLAVDPETAARVDRRWGTYWGG